MKVYLVRHGKTSWNEMRRIQGSSDIPLNDDGRYMAEITAEGMKDIPFELAFSSPLSRARETAEIILRGRGLQIVDDPRIREIGFGGFEGVSMAELPEKAEYQGLRKFFRDPENYIPERGAESIPDIYGRGREFLHEMIFPHMDEDINIFVASHGAMIRALMACTVQDRPENFWGDKWGNANVPLKNCSSTICTVENGVLKVLEEGRIFYDPGLA